jgi:hypothetical protein
VANLLRQAMRCSRKEEHDAAAGGSGARVKRKGVKRRQRQAKPGTAKGGDTLSLLPMEIQIGDRFTDEEGEWEVVSHPATLHGAKSLRARVRRRGQPADERTVTWPAHVRVEIRQGTGR